MNKLRLYFSNLNKYVWRDSNNRIVIIESTSWLWGCYIYPLVTYYYYDEAVKGEPILNILSRYDFIQYMTPNKYEKIYT